MVNVYLQRFELQCKGNPIAPVCSLFRHHFQDRFRKPIHPRPVSEPPEIRANLPIIETLNCLTEN